MPQPNVRFLSCSVAVYSSDDDHAGYRDRTAPASGDGAGSFGEPSELIAHALDLGEAERDTTARRAALLARIGESCAQAERGEGYSEDELRARMGRLRAQHPLAKTA